MSNFDWLLWSPEKEAQELNEEWNQILDAFDRRFYRGNEKCQLKDTSEAEQKGAKAPKSPKSPPT